MNDHAHRTSLAEDSDPEPALSSAPARRFERDDEGSTDVRSRPHLGGEESDTLMEPPTLPNARSERDDPWGSSTTRTGVGSLRQQAIEDAERAGDPGAGRPRSEPVDDVKALWLTFERSLGRPVDRPERLRIEPTLALSSLEVTTLRKILGWLRQIDAVEGAAGLSPVSSGATLLIPVEQGRIVLTPPLLAHLRSAARADEPEALTLTRWLCALARHHRALPWELIHHPVAPFGSSARRVSALELLLACRPELRVVDDLATSFAAQAASLAEETWIFARGQGAEPIDGLIFVDAPAQRSLDEVYAAAALCAGWLTHSAQLGVLGARMPAWFGLDASLHFGVAGPRSVSLQRAPLRSMGLIVSKLHAMEPIR